MTKSVQMALGPMAVNTVDSRLPTTANAVDIERLWLALVSKCLGVIGMNHEAARITMDVDRGTFSKQLSAAPDRHLSFRKMVHLGPDFWREMNDQICEFHGITPSGLTAQDQEDLRLGRMFREMVQRSHTR